MAILNESVFLLDLHRCIAYPSTAPYRTESFGDMTKPAGEDGDIWQAEISIGTGENGGIYFATICPSSLVFRVTYSITSGDPSLDFAFLVNDVTVYADGWTVGDGVKEYTMTLPPNLCGNVISFIYTTEAIGGANLTLQIL